MRSQAPNTYHCILEVLESTSFTLEVHRDLCSILACTEYNMKYYWFARATDKQYQASICISGFSAFYALVQKIITA